MTGPVPRVDSHDQMSAMGLYHRRSDRGGNALAARTHEPLAGRGESGR